MESSPRALHCITCGAGAGRHAKCEPVDNRPKVTCALCGIERRRLIAHLKTAHDLSAAQYEAAFPGSFAWVAGSFDRSEDCRRKQSKAATDRWAKVEERKAQSERLKISAPWLGKSLSDAHKKAIGDGGRGVPHDLSEEARRKIGSRGREVLAQIRLRPGFRALLSAAAVRRIAGDSSHGFRNPVTRQKSFQTKLLRGTMAANKYGRGIHGYRGDIDLYVRSTLEANFARILRYANVPYAYEPEIFQIGTSSAYVPDFRLDSDLLFLDGTVAVPAGWVELKGYRLKDGSLPGGADVKLALFRNLTGTDISVLVPTEDIYARLESEYRPVIPLWETPRFNLRRNSESFLPPVCHLAPYLDSNRLQ